MQIYIVCLSFSFDVIELIYVLASGRIYVYVICGNKHLHKYPANTNGSTSEKRWVLSLFYTHTHSHRHHHTHNTYAHTTDTHTNTYTLHMYLCSLFLSSLTPTAYTSFFKFSFFISLTNSYTLFFYLFYHKLLCHIHTISISLSLYLSISLSPYIFISLSIYLSIYLSLYPSISISFSDCAIRPSQEMSPINFQAQIPQSKAQIRLYWGGGQKMKIAKQIPQYLRSENPRISSIDVHFSWDFLYTHTQLNLRRL